MSDPISGFAVQARPAALETAWTLTAIHRGLTGRTIGEGETLETRLARLEDRLESATPLPLEEVVKLQNEATEALAARLVARGAAAGLPRAQPVQLQAPGDPRAARDDRSFAAESGKSGQGVPAGGNDGAGGAGGAGPGVRLGAARRRAGHHAAAATAAPGRRTGGAQRVLRSRDRHAHGRPAGHPRRPDPRKPDRPAAGLQPGQHGARPARSTSPRPGRPSARSSPRASCSTPTTRSWPTSGSVSRPGWAGRCSICASRSSPCSRRAAIPGMRTMALVSPGATSVPCCSAASTAPATSPAIRRPVTPDYLELRVGPAEHGDLSRRPAVPSAQRRPDARRAADPGRRDVPDVRPGHQPGSPGADANGAGCDHAGAGGGDDAGAAARRRHGLAVPPRRCQRAADEPAAGPRRQRRGAGPTAGMRRHRRRRRVAHRPRSERVPCCWTPAAPPCTTSPRRATPACWTWPGTICCICGWNLLDRGIVSPFAPRKGHRGEGEAPAEPEGAGSAGASPSLSLALPEPRPS